MFEEKHETSLGPVRTSWWGNNEQAQVSVYSADEELSSWQGKRGAFYATFFFDQFEEMWNFLAPQPVHGIFDGVELTKTEKNELREFILLKVMPEIITKETRQKLRADFVSNIPNKIAELNTRMDDLSERRNEIDKEHQTLYSVKQKYLKELGEWR